MLNDSISVEMLMIFVYHQRKLNDYDICLPLEKVGWVGLGFYAFLKFEVGTFALSLNVQQKNQYDVVQTFNMNYGVLHSEFYQFGISRKNKILKLIQR